jgi:hypothetical protein
MAVSISVLVSVSVTVSVSVSFSVTVTLTVATVVFSKVVGKKTVVVTRVGDVVVVLDDSVHEDCSGIVVVVDLDFAKLGRNVVRVIIGRSCTVVVTMGFIVIVLVIGDAVTSSCRPKNNLHMDFRILRVLKVWSVGVPGSVEERRDSKKRGSSWKEARLQIEPRKSKNVQDPNRAKGKKRKKKEN